MQLSEMNRIKTHFNVPHGENSYNATYNDNNRVKMVKRLCHVGSRDRHYSPSLPGNRYLKLSSKKRSPGRNLGEHRLARRSGTASRGTATGIV